VDTSGKKASTAQKMASIANNVVKMLNSGTQNEITRARKMVKGLTLEWEDLNPFDERSVVTTKVSHANHMARIWAPDLVRNKSNPVFTKMRFTWDIKITLFFEYPNKDKYEEEVELQANCLLKDVNDVCLREIQNERKRHADDAYRFTKFNVLCTGI